ncbi:metallophosphoesterase family protein [Desulfatiferula olefinivorans]
MKIAVFADIHGNLEAFTAVLAHIRRHHVDALISLGDNVGYGADPEAVMDLIRENDVLCVLGNHEKAMNEDAFINWFNPLAQMAVRYTKSRLSPRSLADIRDYPTSLVFESLRFVHGTPPDSPVLYLFQLSDAALIRKMRDMSETLCFVGHTHQLGLIRAAGDTLVRESLPLGDIRLDPARPTIVNAGSVGQPRDEDKRAKYLRFDTDTRILTVEAVAYDNAAAADKILKAGIPADFARKLLP